MEDLNVKPAYKQVIAVWWRFFWRTALLQIILLVAGGFVINYLSKINPALSLLYVYIYHAMVITLIPLLVFWAVFGRKPRKSSLILVPMAVKRNSQNPKEMQVGFFRLLLSWWSYIWRYSALVIFSVIAIKQGLMLAGVNFAQGLFPPKWQMLCLNTICIPVSLLVFIILMRRKAKRRTFDVVQT
ncbi:MAG: hypothetical protein WC071_13765, partial [Victivallaceae bacterium]